MWMFVVSVLHDMWMFVVSVLHDMSIFVVSVLGVLPLNMGTSRKERMGK